MKILKTIKKAIYKICGKARWHLLALALLLGITFLIGLDYSLYPYTNGVSDGNGFIYECQIDNTVSLSVTDGGKIAFLGTDYGYKAFAVTNLDTGVQDYCGIGTIPNPNAGEIELFYPMNFALTDDGYIYAVHNHQTEDASLFNMRPSVVRLSSDYKYLGNVFSVDSGKGDSQSEYFISNLHYFDGKVYFAVLELTGVRLYTIDTKTQVVSESSLYPTDPDGTYTASVIPVDGYYIFMRSDGNVYKVEFDQPMGECIYHFETFANEGIPYFDGAATADGKLYVAAGTDTTVVYLLEDGKLTKVFDAGSVSDKPGDFVSLDSYRPEGASSDTLVLCMENALITYSGGSPVLRNVTLRPQITFLMHLVNAISYLIIIPLVGLVINLIIRKKTLLYKQLIITIPVFVVLATIIAVNIYTSVDHRKLEDVEQSITAMSSLAAQSFDGYDFTGFEKPDQTTGAAYINLMDKIGSLNSYNKGKSNSGFLYSVIYRADNGKAYRLAADLRLNMPMQVSEELNEKFPENSTDVYIDKDFGDIVGINASSSLSTITAYKMINDSNSTGRYYLRVEADYGTLFIDRVDIYFQIGLYTLVIISVIVILLILSTLLMMRVIKKATNTVKSISEGDLTARVNYRSKDELGQICSQVNEMAASLEKSFDEKDRTEKFYYKFVPEKFREYLGKENFTDLALGDASSRELTVLFCDIRSFSINSEMMTAKENFAFVNTIYGKAGPIIREHNGFIDKYIGDAVMALFENADDAVAAGVDLYRAIVLDPETARELKVSDINIGIGIHTGMAMIGIVGESERLSGTVISDTVNLSSRLESLTKQYQTAILVSKDTVDHLTSPEDLSLRYLGMIQVAGVNEVKGVYEVLDCLQEDKKSVRSDNSKDFREALRLFQLGRREEALKAMEKLASEGRNDHVTDMYADYIRNLSPDDKGNVFRFVRK